MVPILRTNDRLCRQQEQGFCSCTLDCSAFKLSQILLKCREKSALTVLFREGADDLARWSPLTLVESPEELIHDEEDIVCLARQQQTFRKVSRTTEYFGKVICHVLYVCTRVQYVAFLVHTPFITRTVLAYEGTPCGSIPGSTKVLPYFEGG